MFGGKYFCRRDRDKHNFTDKLPFGIASNKHPEVQQVVVFKGTKPKQIYIEMARQHYVVSLGLQRRLTAAWHHQPAGHEATLDGSHHQKLPSVLPVPSTSDNFSSSYFAL